MTVLDDIAAERQRQVAKGHDAMHDDTHTDGAIIWAGWGARARLGVGMRSPERRQKLVEAAALIVAEIERMDRLDRMVKAAREMLGETAPPPEPEPEQLDEATKRTEAVDLLSGFPETYRSRLREFVEATVQHREQNRERDALRQALMAKLYEPSRVYQQRQFLTHIRDLGT